MTGENIEIKVAASEPEKEELYKFWYKIYIEKMNKKLDGTDHQRKMIIEELDSWGVLFYAVAQSEIIGTLRLNIGRADDFPEELEGFFTFSAFNDFSPKPVLSYSGRLMVSEPYQGSTVLYQLLAKAFIFAREQGVQYNFGYCAPELVGLYEQLGYRRYKDYFICKNMGFRIPLILLTEDIDHLSTIRSPLYRLAKKFPNVPASLDYLVKHFPNSRLLQNRSLVQNFDLWELLSERLHESPSEKISLFRGLEKKEIELVLKNLITFKNQAGEYVIRTGEVGNEIYIVLSGAYEVCRLINEETYSIAILGPGEIFGEMAFVSKKRRTADVKALISSEIIVLSARNLEKIMEKQPKIAARMLLNLSAILCQRLGTTTDNWLESRSG